MYLVLTALWFHLLMCCTLALRLYIVTAYTEDLIAFYKWRQLRVRLQKLKGRSCCKKAWVGVLTVFAVDFLPLRLTSAHLPLVKGNLFSILKYHVCTLLSLV